MTPSAYGLMKFPEKLEKVISQSGKSQSSLSRETGVGQSAISAMTRGDRRPFMDQAFRIARALGVSLDFLADDEVDEPVEGGLSEDDQAILDLFHALELDKKEALRRLATPVGAPARSPLFNPDNPWVGPQRDTTERYLREKQEEQRPAVKPKGKPRGGEPRSGGNGKSGEGKKGSEGKR